MSDQERAGYEPRGGTVIGVQLERHEPTVRVPHKGDGFTIYSMDEARELAQELAAVVREIDGPPVRTVSVSWADSAVDAALAALLDYREGNIQMLHPASEAVAIAIDTLRSVGADPSGRSRG